MDTYVYAYDSNGNELGRNDDGGPGLNSRLQINVVAGQTYYVRADAFSSSTGRYDLNLTTQVDDHGMTKVGLDLWAIDAALEAFGGLV